MKTCCDYFMQDDPRACDLCRSFVALTQELIGVPPPPEPRTPLHEEPTCEHAADPDAIREEPVFRGEEIVAIKVTCMRCKP